MYSIAPAGAAATQIPPDGLDAPELLPQPTPPGSPWQPGWIISYPLGRAAPVMPSPAGPDAQAGPLSGPGPSTRSRPGLAAPFPLDPERGATLELHVAGDVRRNEEPLMEALATIGTTRTGELLLTDLSRKLAHHHIKVTRAARPQLAGMAIDAHGGLHMALFPDTLLSHGASMQAYSSREPFPPREQYACGLFEFLLGAMNHFTAGSPVPAERLHLHPQTMAFRQELLDTIRPAGEAPAPVAESARNGYAQVGLRFNLDDNMAAYRDGFQRALLTLRGAPLGARLLKALADVIAARTMHVYHAGVARDAGILLGHDGSAHWYYNVGAAAAHGALLQFTDDDLTQDQREACAAFDILRKTWESLCRESGAGTPRIAAGQRLDLDRARRDFRDDLMDVHRGYGAPAAGPDDRMRV
ncbi:hypothetical protein CAL12_08535 [Bordetella genomosp. 8]|uniref:Uncharacterized protein n=1 Tax=Bordetella genomosp. 8 TaxID=1416806 RepID=A0A1W6YIK3_9BORD|nr:hypothetical protein [Bordetella genomosp. 8]ARP80882.1 hypothetical protein CAL12_08535 [Bordetella genomosp. 8]